MFPDSAIGIVTQGCSPAPVAAPNPTTAAIVGFPNITVSNPQDWSNAEIAELTSVLKNEVLPVFGNSPDTFARAVGNISVTVVPDNTLGNNAAANAPFDQINFEHRIFGDDFGIIHGFGHQFDWEGYEDDAQRTQWRSQQFVEDPAININILGLTQLENSD